VGGGVSSHYELSRRRDSFESEKSQIAVGHTKKSTKRRIDRVGIRLLFAGPFGSEHVVRGGWLYKLRTKHRCLGCHEVSTTRAICAGNQDGKGTGQGSPSSHRMPGAGENKFDKGEKTGLKENFETAGPQWLSTMAPERMRKCPDRGDVFCKLRIGRQNGPNRSRFSELEKNGRPISSPDQNGRTRMAAMKVFSGAAQLTSAEQLNA